MINSEIISSGKELNLSNNFRTVKLKYKYIYQMILLLVLCSVYVHAQSIEYVVKASLIEKFARFSEWESNSTGEYFVIDILGISPFNGELEKLARKTKIKDKQIKINYIKDFSEIKNPQVLFICSSEKYALPKTIKYIENKNIMTIADTPGFSEMGVHFNFYFNENWTIHFEINPSALKKSKLKADIQLLKIGKIINQAEI